MLGRRAFVTAMLQRHVRFMSGWKALQAPISYTEMTGGGWKRDFKMQNVRPMHFQQRRFSTEQQQQQQQQQQQSQRKRRKGVDSRLKRLIGDSVDYLKEDGQEGGNATKRNRDVIQLLNEWSHISPSIPRHRQRETAELMDKLASTLMDKKPSSSSSSSSSKATTNIRTVGNGAIVAIHAWAKLGEGKRADKLQTGLVECQKKQSSSLKDKEVPQLPIETYVGVIDAWAKDTDQSMDRALYWLRQMRAAYATATDPATEAGQLRAYNCVLQGYANRGESEEALQFFRNMPVPQDSYSYSLVMKALSRSDHHPRKSDIIQDLFEELKTKYQQEVAALAENDGNNNEENKDKENARQRRRDALLPNSVVYGAVMMHCSPSKSQSLLSELHQLYDTLQDPAVKPNVRHYAIVMNAWNKARNPVRVEEIFLEMVQHYENGLDTVRPNQYVRYSLVINVVCCEELT